MRAYEEDTIVAVSTPPGEGGIAVIRLSGARALVTAESVFQSDSGDHGWESHRAYHGWIYDGQEPIDEVVLTPFVAPKSYTGEDVVEIGCHGGLFVSRRIVECLVDVGARPANPGEFTQRAYINGKFDLAQAEAVADLIKARTEASRRVAVYQLEGRLSDELEEMRKQLTHICALLELELDFSDEEVEFASREEFEGLMKESRARLERLVESYRRGRACREGVRMVILGRPNVGKSSLLNRLVEKERAIVTEVPGTTRDTIEEVLDIEGILFTITDTAGMRQTDDPVESEGVKRSERALEDSDLILLVLDGSESLTDEDTDLIRRIEDCVKPYIVVVNKSDLKQNIMLDSNTAREEPVRLSALNGEGIDRLIRRLEQLALDGELPHEREVVLTNERHYRALQEAYSLMVKADESLSDDMSQEFIVMDLRGALDALGQVTGKTTADDILNGIFSDFCIGK